MTRSSPPSRSWTRSRMIAEPEDVAGIEERGPDPGRDLALLLVADRPEVLERPLGVLDGVERGVEVDLERGRLRAQVRLGVASATTAVAPGSTLVSTCSPIDDATAVATAAGRSTDPSGAPAVSTATSSSEPPAAARSTAAW